jgi:hypothetical protein
MRGPITALASCAAILIGACASTRPAAAEVVYPFCATPTWSEGLDCDYRTREECLAINAGFARTCVPNPRYGVEPQAAPAPARRIRR